MVYQIKKPVEVTVVEEQESMFGSDSRPQQARIRYGKGKEGGVLYEAIVKK